MRRPKKRKIPHRRRREGKTNYRKRLELLKSGKPRIVIRRNLNSISCQIVKYLPEGDITLVNSNSLELRTLVGWKAHTGNIPAAYLTGLLCGQRALKKNIKNAILDIGMQTSTRASGLYSALKGAIDAGLEIPHSKDILPDENRISGIHIQNYAENLKKDNPSAYRKLFSSYLKNNILPEKFTEYFNEAKDKITQKVSVSKPRKATSKAP